LISISVMNLWNPQEKTSKDMLISVLSFIWPKLIFNAPKCLGMLTAQMMCGPRKTFRNKLIFIQHFYKCALKHGIVKPLPCGVLLTQNRGYRLLEMVYHGMINIISSLLIIRWSTH
jgi:hypothetical protein